MQSINPYTGKFIADYENYSAKSVSQIVDLTDSSFQEWKKVSFQEKAKRMLKLKQVLIAQEEELASLITAEMGKVKHEALSEIRKCASVCEFYAENAEAFLKNEVVKTEATESFVSFRPLGIILAVMPWNFPFWQVFRFLAPALMAGNTGLLKHASNVSGCALAIEKLVIEAGFPDHVFRTLLISGAEVKAVIENPKVKAVTLTGSTPAGKAVASAAGQALKKSVLELGGSDPYIICDDANIEEAASLCVASRLINAGQSCIGAKRFIVFESVYEAFKNEFVKRMQAASFGDPNDTQTTIGPLARIDLRDELHQQVINSKKLGAKILCGGYIPESKAALYPPTVLENIQSGMPAYHEELFGPVAALFCVKNMDEALRIANDTVFGLGAGIFTSDMNKGKLIAEKGLDAGCVFVNDFVKSNPNLPFGGIKESGYGRELSSFGIREFVNIKTVVIK